MTFKCANWENISAKSKMLRAIKLSIWSEMAFTGNVHIKTSTTLTNTNCTETEIGKLLPTERKKKFKPNLHKIASGLKLTVPLIKMHQSNDHYTPYIRKDSSTTVGIYGKNLTFRSYGRMPKINTDVNETLLRTLCANKDFAVAHSTRNLWE